MQKMLALLQVIDLTNKQNAATLTSNTLDDFYVTNNVSIWQGTSTTPSVNIVEEGDNFHSEDEEPHGNELNRLGGSRGCRICESLDLGKILPYRGWKRERRRQGQGRRQSERYGE